jgi:hypothetical protein
MNESNTLSTVPRIRPFRTVLLPLEVLIEVPELKGCQMVRGRTQSPRHAATSPPSFARTRRRLRREVRVAGCALLALMPIVSACTSGWSSRPSRVVACSIANATAESKNLAAFASPDQGHKRGSDALAATRAVLLSDEATGVGPGNDVEVPVVFPGYLLPVDSLEDAAHEGS